jgi:hypothetical protein
MAKDLQISSILFMRHDWDWKLKNNLSFGVTHYLTGHNLGCDHEDACKKLTHLIGFPLYIRDKSVSISHNSEDSEGENQSSSLHQYFENDYLSFDVNNY